MAGPCGNRVGLRSKLAVYGGALGVTWWTLGSHIPNCHSVVRFFKYVVGR